MDPRFLKRLTNEYKRMVDNPNCPYTVELKDKDMREWIVTIPGPADSPYEGLNFKLSISIPSGWPFEPPKFKFISKVFHPNVWENGEICLDVNKPEKYSPALDMEARVDNLVILLQDANCSSPANGAAAYLWKDKAAFKKQVHAFYSG